MQNGYQFAGNIQLQGELINKVERELAASFIANNDTDYVLQNYEKVALNLTTPELKQQFMNAINELSMVQSQENIDQISSGPRR